MKSNISLAAFSAAIRTGNITAANDQSLLFPAFNEALPGSHGEIYAANDANFDATHLSEPLSEYIVGAPDDEGLQEALDAIAPPIPVGRAFTYRTHNTRESFQTDSENDGDIREIGGDFKEVRRTGAQAEGRTDNKGLIMVLDNDQGGEDSAVQQRAVTNLRNRLLRSDLRRALAVLDANDTNTDTNWGTAVAAADPDMDLMSDIDTAGDARGINSNQVVYGSSAWIKRLQAFRRQDSAGSVASAMMARDQVAQMIGAESVIVLPFRYQSGAAEGAKAKVIGDAVFSYYAKRGLMPDDPSNIKRFITSAGGQMFRVYILQKLKKTLVVVEHYSRVLAASTLGIRKRTVTYTA